MGGWMDVAASVVSRGVGAAATNMAVEAPQ
jgi:hypothetical protein